MSQELNHARDGLKIAEETFLATQRAHAMLPELLFCHHAEEKIAHLRLFIARGRLMALKRCRHAHLACEESPRVGS